jgi:hypothetical protein
VIFRAEIVHIVDMTMIGILFVRTVPPRSLQFMTINFVNIPDLCQLCPATSKIFVSQVFHGESTVEASFPAATSGGSGPNVPQQTGAARGRTWNEGPVLIKRRRTDPPHRMMKTGQGSAEWGRQSRSDPAQSKSLLF